MKYLIHVFLIFLIGCGLHSVEENQKSYHHIDSAMHNSKKLHDSTIYLHKLMDENTKNQVEKVISKVEYLKSDNEKLRTEVLVLNQKSKLVEKITIHDTVFITEKKNFWGKTKITTDSSSSVTIDSIETEN